MPIFRFPFFYHPNYYNRFASPNKYYSTENGDWQFRQYPCNRVISNDFNRRDNNNTNSHINNSNDNNSAPNPTHFNRSDEQAKEGNLKKNQKNNSKDNCHEENYFFELFGLKLYFDDILLICLIFFLYQEGVKDDELFLSLVLLLLS